MSPARRDVALLAAAVPVAAAATAVAYAAGARLGAALTLGVGLLVAAVIAHVGREARRRPGPSGETPAPSGERAPRDTPQGRVPDRARATRRRR